MSGTGRDARELPFCAASDRNRHPIHGALDSRLPANGRLLEIGAGNGQHAVFMAPRFAGLDWLPTDCAEMLNGLQARLDAEPAPNLRRARALDVRRDPWPDGPFNVVYSANTAHIMSWKAVCAMFSGVDSCLAPDGAFYLYGPFNIDGRYTSSGNEAFDHDLRDRGADMGLRDLEALESLAANHHMQLQERLEMPANNMLLVFKRPAEGHS